ncbi:MAG: CDGSH iron-sulfur domain-containing protein [Polyangiaceae bacterium]|nr:CDGSH iron-sulfur domain-containing protein [Myxococcales bacterium]MCB9584964.1 CDGSH iron-sulfur domain-containing protein [Polyangiaceae bacterium]MCB9607463.1 CDGSH iron-sulfur domain-containing protein [Polyangiaceae bacterium]
MSNPEAALVIQSREELAELLTEACEIEHNLMCCYLYAAWSLKTAEDGLEGAQLTAVERWRNSIVNVAIDEMAHLVNANNLLVAIGGPPHLRRPNFPIPRGYHPADIVVELHPFDQSTIDHFVFLERPEGVDHPDGAGFSHSVRYRRVFSSQMLLPSAQDYGTVGHMYREVRAGVERLVATLGEEALFVGDPAVQLGPDLVNLEGVVAVVDAASAYQAIDEVVAQGEGHSEESPDSHYRRFRAIQDEYRELQAADPSFVPARDVAKNPVQRFPPAPEGKTWVEEPSAARVLDFGNAIYNQMLRLLAVAYSPVSAGERRAAVDEAVAIMHALPDVSDVLTALPARPEGGECAGISFAMTRQLRVPGAASAMQLLAERTDELARGAELLKDVSPRFEAIASNLVGSADRLRAQAPERPRRRLDVLPEAPAAVQPAAVQPTAAQAAAPAEAAADEPAAEVVEGQALTLSFDSKRCIHARFCVLGAPRVFLANTPGEWIYPDQMPAEELAAIARRCPSGAITYTRKDGGFDEQAPEVNTLHIRENGPYAVVADLHVSGQDPRFRATLCRCGASKHKPYCDGSHNAAGFAASGEPATGDTTSLAARDGRLTVEPLHDGPLSVSGNLEICAGTGRTVARITRAKLCRCGGSANKPFCDGTHRRIGFRSES